MAMPNYIFRIVLLSQIVLLCACSSHLGSARSEQAYALEIPIYPVQRAIGSGSGVIMVNVPEAAPGFDSPSMVYVDKAFKLGSYRESRWADTLPKMVVPIVVAALESGGAFTAVVKTSNGVPADYRLDIDGLDLHHDVLSTPAAVIMNLRAQLVDLRLGSIIASQSFSVSIPSQGEDAYSGVAAANQAARDIFSRVAKFCAERARRLPDGK